MTTISTDIRRGLAALALIAVAAAAPATDWYVATSGNDAANGRALTTPFKTVQRAVNAAAPGDTVWIRGGTYRGQVTVSGKAGSATKPLVIAAYGSEKPVLKGSQQVTGWTLASGTTWKHTGWSYPSQQVFANDVALTQIGPVPSHYNGNAADGSWMLKPIGTGLSTMTAGSFFYDGAAKVLYVRLADGSDPNKHVIEASTDRRIVLASGSSYVTVRGLTFRHSNGSAYEQMPGAIELGTGCRLEKCDIQWCDFAGVNLAYQKNGAAVVGCVVSNNGDVGIEGATHANFLVSGCTLANNNYRHFNGSWHGGGAKVTTNSWGVFTKNTVTGNKAAGLWFDWCATANLSQVHCNYLADNVHRTGTIDMEGSKNVLVFSNVLVNNEIRGIYVSASDNVRVYNNTIVGTRSYAAIDVGGMPRSGKTLTNVAVFNNILSGNTAQSDLHVLKPNGGDIANITCDDNLIWRPTGGVALWYGADSRGGWSGVTATSLAAWQKSTPLDHHSVQANPQFAVASGTNWSCTAASPTINKGKALSEVKMAFDGGARPLGGAYDMGAFER